MFQENPHALLVLVMLLQEAQNRGETGRLPHPRQRCLSKRLSGLGRRSIGGLVILLVAMGQRLQAVLGESGGGV